MVGRRMVDCSSIKRHEGAERDSKYCNNQYTLLLCLSVRATMLCVTLSVSVSTWAFWACRAPLSIQSPSFLSLSLFSHSPSPWGWDTTQIAQYCQIKSRCPLSHFNTAPVWDPPYPLSTQLCFSESRGAGEYLLYHRGYEKTCVDLRGDVRGDETGLSSACQQKINHPLDNYGYPGGMPKKT